MFNITPIIWKWDVHSKYFLFTYYYQKKNHHLLGFIFTNILVHKHICIPLVSYTKESSCCCLIVAPLLPAKSSLARPDPAQVFHKPVQYIQYIHLAEKEAQ